MTRNSAIGSPSTTTGPQETGSSSRNRDPLGDDLEDDDHPNVPPPSYSQHFHQTRNEPQHPHPDGLYYTQEQWCAIMAERGYVVISQQEHHLLFEDATSWGMWLAERHGLVLMAIDEFADYQRLLIEELLSAGVAPEDIPPFLPLHDRQIWSEFPLLYPQVPVDASNRGRSGTTSSNNTRSRSLSAAPPYPGTPPYTRSPAGPHTHTPGPEFQLPVVNSPRRGSLPPMPGQTSSGVTSSLNGISSALGHSSEYSPPAIDGLSQMVGSESESNRLMGYGHGGDRLPNGDMSVSFTGVFDESEEVASNEVNGRSGFMSRLFFQDHREYASLAQADDGINPVTGSIQRTQTSTTGAGHRGSSGPAFANGDTTATTGQVNGHGQGMGAVLVGNSAIPVASSGQNGQSRSVSDTVSATARQGSFYRQIMGLGALERGLGRMGLVRRTRTMESTHSRTPGGGSSASPGDVEDNERMSGTNTGRSGRRG